MRVYSLDTAIMRVYSVQGSYKVLNTTECHLVVCKLGVCHYYLVQYFCSTHTASVLHVVLAFKRISSCFTLLFSTPLPYDDLVKPPMHVLHVAYCFAFLISFLREILEEILPFLCVCVYFFNHWND